MFKKSFAALAVLGFCASYANASSVILYVSLTKPSSSRTKSST